VPGYTCVHAHCGGPSDAPGSIDCGPTIAEPSLAHSCGTDYNTTAGKASLAACITDAAKQCNDDANCRAFALDPKQWSSSKAKLFPTVSVVANPGWNTWTKDAATTTPTATKGTPKTSSHAAGSKGSHVRVSRHKVCGIP
jgi:hypothetical protein